MNDLKAAFNPYIGKPVTYDDATMVPSMCEVLEDSGDVISVSIDLRPYNPDPVPGSIEVYWKIQIILNLDLDEHRIIRRIVPDANLYAANISGLGETKAAAFWTEEDEEAALEFLRLLTKVRI